MVRKVLQRDRGKAIILSATCFAMALWSMSCGGGGSSSPVSTPVPGFNASTDTLNFNSVFVLTPSPITATVTNTGQAQLSISGVAITGTNASDFTESNTCSNAVAAGGNCSITVTFTPSAAGTRSATATFTDNAASSPQSVSLTGIGIAPAVQLSTQGLTFGSQLVGTPVTQPVTLANTGTAPLTINTISLPTGTGSTYFTQTSTCPLSPSTLAMSTSCTISVTFDPTSPGTFSPGSITITDNANGQSGSTQTISLSGTGSGPLASLPTSTPFATTGVGLSTTQTVTLTNIGNANLTVSNVTATVTSGTNPFSIVSSTCLSAAVVPNGTCNVEVEFAPVADSTVTGMLTFFDNSQNNPNSPQIYQLTGTGSGANPVVSLSASTLAFGSQSLNTLSGSLSVAITNTGNANLIITANGTNSGIAITAPFQINTTSSTCSTTSAVTLAPAGGSCTVTIQFEPTTTGSAPASALTFTDNNDGNSGSTQSVTLTGVGTSSVASIAPISLTFGNVNVGSTSSPLTTTVTNTSGTENLSLSGISISGTNSNDFATSTTGITSPCANGGTLAPLASCSINLTFTPVAEGNGLTATFNMTASNANGNQSVAGVTLTGTGLGSVINPSPTSLSFGAVAIGTTTPPQQTVTVANNGNAQLTFSSAPVVTGTNASEFNLATGTTCSSATPVAAGSSCTIGVTFAPTSTATVSGTVLSVPNNSGNTPSLQITLSGSGTGPTANLSTSSLSFSSVALGSSSQQSLTLTNNGNSSLSYSGTSISGTYASDYSASSTCGSTVAANGGNCTITVTFTPSTPPNPGTSLTASLTPTDNAPSNTTVSLSGTGTGPLASLTGTLSFNQAAGTTSSPQIATLTNNGNAALAISSIALTTSSAFAETNNCPASLAAGANCTVNVTFTPPTPGSFSATLTVTDNSGNQSSTSQSLTVSGNGTGPGASPNPTSLTFSSQDEETTSAPQAITLTNNGTSILTISGIATGGTNASNFALVSSTGTVCPYSGGTLAANSACTIYVTFSPSAVATYSATINITDNAAGSPQTISLTGSGVQGIQFSPSSLSFSSAFGTTSSAQTVSVSNPTGSSSNVTINGVSLAGSGSSSFTLVSTTCTNVTLTPGGASCAIVVEFTPPAPGTISASISVADTLNSSPQTVSLSGSGTGPFASLSPTSYTFTAQNINSSPSSAQLVSTLSNSGTASMTISGITSSDAEFVLAAGSGQCTYSGQTLAAGASCKIYATFAPTAEGLRTSVVSVADNATGSPQTVTLNGTGDAPIATLSTGNPGTLTFNPLALGTTTTQNFTLTNSGNYPLTLSGPALTGTGSADFQATTCPTSLAANTLCTITVTFAPVTPGSLSATLTFTDNTNLASGSTQTVTLNGTGSGASPSPSPSPLSFGNQTQGVTSSPGTIMVTNQSPPSNLSFTISSVTIPTSTYSGDFAISSNGCTSSVAIGSSCSINVTFDPSTTSTESATVLITYTAYPNTQSVTVTGTGTSSPVSLSPSPLNFSAQAVTSPATAGTAQAMTLSYSGTAGTLSSSGIAVSGGANPGDFILTTGANSCPNPGTLSGTSCTIWVEFAPTATGSRSATLSVTDNAAGSPQTATLTGTGASGNITFSSSSLSLGDSPVGQSIQGACGSVSGSNNCVTVTNTGNATLTVSNIAVGGTNATQFTTNSTYTTCSTTVPLAINGSCVVDVTFTPTTASVSPSSFSANLSFTDTATTSPQSVGLTGTGLAPESVLSTNALAFCTSQDTSTCPSGLSGWPVMTPSPLMQNITLQNTGNAALTISGGNTNSSITGTNPGDFTINGPTCGSSLAAGSSCLIPVTYVPLQYPSSGASSATLTITTNNNNTSGFQQTVALSGDALHDVLLTWKASSTYGVTGYNVYRGTSSGQEKPANGGVLLTPTPLPATTLSFADGTVNQTTATPYYYVVTAVAGGVESVPSNEVEETPP